LLECLLKAIKTTIVRGKKATRVRVGRDHAIQVVVEMTGEKTMLFNFRLLEYNFLITIRT